MYEQENISEEFIIKQDENHGRVVYRERCCAKLKRGKKFIFTVVGLTILAVSGVLFALLSSRGTSSEEDDNIPVPIIPNTPSSLKILCSR